MTSLDYKTIFTAIYGDCDYILNIVNLKLSPIFNDKTEIPPDTIIFKTTDGKEVRYQKEETNESIFIRSNYGQ
nr:MAG TPA: hypothetical protein [Caudoviricetes sp.]